MALVFKDVVALIKKEGCRVIVYKYKDTIYGGNRGTFDYNDKGPIICIAIKNLCVFKKIEILLHEYGHFLQWKAGFMQYLDGIYNAYELYPRWIDKKVELTPSEVNIMRNIVLTMEYDAERRGLEAGRSLKPLGFDEKRYMQGAAAYVATLKWEFLRRQKSCETPKRKMFKQKMLTNDELFAPLSEQEIKKLDKCLIKKVRKGYWH